MSDDKNEATEAVERLRKLLKPGDTVYTVLRHVARSGMSRSVSVVVVRKGEPLRLDHTVATALGLRVDRAHDGVVVSGGGMDMGWNLVYRLGQVLWPTGTPRPHGTRNGLPDTEGGYALTHRWL